MSDKMSKVHTQTMQLNQLIVIKRDGRQEKFNAHKLKWSLIRAGWNEEETKTWDSICMTLLHRTQNRIKAEDISDIVVNEQLHQAWQDNYIRYAHTSQTLEAQASDLNYQIQQLTQKEQTIVNENANKDSRVFNTQRDLSAGVIAKAVGLKMLPPKVRKAHLKGQIHYHDLDYHPYAPMTNCCLIDFKTMFEEGFQIGNAQVESPKSIQTATAQMAQIIANVASSQYGGTSVNRVDELLEHYAEKNYQKHLMIAKQWIDDSAKQDAYAKERTAKDIYDAMQSLEYEINTLYTSQGQTPFTTLGFGLGTSWYAREIQKAILNVRILGLGQEKRTAIFPKLVFTLKKGVNFSAEDPNYDIKQLALECSTKRMYPDVLMYDKIVDLTGSFKVPMGCRSFLQGWHDDEGNEVNEGRMNLGVVTLNLPRIAIESRGDKQVFWQLLEERLAVVAEALEYRIQRVKEAMPENAPILYQHGAFGMRLSADESVDKVFNNRRATISMGYIGLYEVATVFYGSQWENNPAAKAFTVDILRHMKEYTDKKGEETGYHFSIYATPSESLTDRFCRMDTSYYGDIADITDKGYYTNSFHYDVRKQPTPFEKIQFEAEYLPYTSGGFIHYCEYPNMRQNPKALEAVWDFAYDKIGYLGTNTPIDHCYECGYDGDFMPTERGFRCQHCGNRNPETCDVVKRTCGYLGNPQLRPMVKGRHKEISARKKHVRAN
ncbi:MULTISPECIES: anaerobic ribonucleoside-triphosphate reductase [unclassified Facklamia]|uniref:anaerobic ribonucleoside-triphosphate reductase n=1 Tax=Aerococcaceae TaxID=186827 RepID=UPI0013B73012|nr:MULTISPECIES: anaerobic ribonucleoside-triphosphate reductase [unclassified Facklamia]NEW64624.1 anaerobic ribonucleoside-triphosphate reductase [Facklamia sp. 252]NEW67949.1 anaerobic ribonucleoside-triphosphate reductase [Facklamia sp. 253]QQD65437.1 anaerobic ribonucleoside-triphosphate reductase [Aerococcaceae bacterium zg-252]